MSLLSALILPHLEKELLTLDPLLAKFLLEQLKKTGLELVAWAEEKMNVDLNGDGKIGDAE